MDRFVHENGVEALLGIPGTDDRDTHDTVRAGNKYSAMGDICHWTFQTGLGAKFVNDYKTEPDAEMYELAAEFGDKAELNKRALKASSLAARLLRAAMGEAEFEKAEWLAEEAHENSYTRGHTDLRSVDNRWLVDLKSTTQVPDNAPKWEHVFQMAIYYLLTGCSRIVLVYVDMSGANVGRAFVLDFTDEDLQELAERLKNRCIRQMKPWDEIDEAVPAISSHNCRYCPYSSLCEKPLYQAISKPIEVRQRSTALAEFRNA
jgi:CRISPR/Cas system-associated exonuclease Cas4 (RecB family)